MPLIFESQYKVTQPNLTLIDGLMAMEKPQAFSKQQLKTILQQGCVWWCAQNMTHPQRVRRAKKALNIGDTLYFYYNQKILSETPKTAILIEDLIDYSVWYKPKGMPSQGSKWSDHTTIQRWVETHLQRPTFIMHRLDKATDGLILLAHTQKMAKILTKWFETRKIEKIYQAWVKGQFPEIEQDYNEPLDDKKAISHAHLLQYDASTDTSKVQVQIETGRKHQIRRHLSQAGYPIVGDRLYDPLTQHQQDLQLTAVKITLTESVPKKVFTLPETV